jgi:3-oxoacyl-[acyl-carrier-protein] synthase III
MNLDSKALKKTVGSLCQRNIDQLEKKTRDEYRKIKVWGLHTAGARFLDYITSKCNISKDKVALSYSLMKETGNTGAVSSLQFIHESIKRKLLLKNQIGCFIDYGWEGSNILLFKNRK